MSNNPDLASLFGATDATTFLGPLAFSDDQALAALSSFIGVPGATSDGSVGSYCRYDSEALRKLIASLTANVNRFNFEYSTQEENTL